MPERVEISTVTCAAMTTQASPVEWDMSFAPGIVRLIEIIIPRGHAGLTGLAIATAHSIVIPNSGASWIIGDSEKISWPVANYGNAGSWSAFMYNTDVRPHLWQIRFHIDEIDTSRRPVHAAPLDADTIHAAAVRNMQRLGIAR